MRKCLPSVATWALTLTVVDSFSPAMRSAASKSYARVASVQNQPVSASLLRMAEPSTEVDQGPMQEGSHGELMYALGVNLARQLGDVRPLVADGEELASVAKGLLDTVIGRLSDDGQRALLARRGMQLNELIADRANEIRDRLIERGRVMLKEMSENPGAEYLETGVVVHVLQPGTGARPTQASTIKVHYHGTLCDGTVFDSTLDGEPVTFPLAGVIPGWRDGLLKMHEGETAMLGIPPDEAYGAEGTPDGRVPGGSTLFFKVQLLEVMSAGLGGEATLTDAQGNRLSQGGAGGGQGLVGLDGKPH